MYEPRVKETTTTTGTGNLTTAGAVTNFRTFNTAYGLNRMFKYTIVDSVNDDWETGFGYLSAATTLVRAAVIRSSNSDAAVTLGSGTKAVMVAAAADDLIGRSVFPSNVVVMSEHITEIEASNTNSIDANEIHYQPIIIGNRGTFDEFTFEVTTIGTNMRLGLYDDLNGLPQNLLAVHDTSFSVGTIGVKTATFDGGSLELWPGVYWIGFTVDATVALRAAGLDSVMCGTLGFDGGSLDGNVRYDKTRTYAAMPDPADVASLTLRETGNYASIGLVTV